MLTIIGRIRTALGLGGLVRAQGYQSPFPDRYGSPSAATVTFGTAMTVSAFFASTRLISEAIGSMPIEFTMKTKNGVEVLADHPMYRLLRFQPNRHQTSQEFFECVAMNLCTHGNFYGAIQRDDKGAPVQILPLMPAQTDVELLTTGETVYRYRDFNGNMRVFHEDNMWHIKLFGNGIIGLSPLAHARQSLGIALAADSRASTLSANGGKTSGVLMVDKVLSKAQRDQIRKEFKDLSSGSDDQLYILEADMKWQQTSMSPSDQQLLETRKFSVEDVCRFVGVPSILVNHSTSSTQLGSSIAEVISQFYKLNLRPYALRIKASAERKFLTTDEWGKVGIRFNDDDLLRGAFHERVEAYHKGIQSGVFAPNEPRAMEGLPPKEGGNELYFNGNMIPLRMAAQPRVPLAPMNGNGGQ